MGTPSIALDSYKYTPLDSRDSAIRLLKLLKPQGPEIKCQLSELSLSNSEHIPYEALSYVWGSSELVERITLDGKQFWVTDSLYAALQYLRLPDRDRYLWIDAICINQADKKEQGQQVKLMGTIFGSAEGVLFWLGKATFEMMILMDALDQHGRTSAGGDLGQWTLDDNRLDIYRTGLRQMLHRQWFTRAWILQEVAKARKATVCCGSQAVPAEIFARAPFVIGEEPEPHCQAVLDIMPGASRSGSWWEQKRDLFTLLRRFQASKATDERDKIYALIGMSSDPLDIQSIDIDYEKPTHQTIHGAVTHLLHCTPVSVHEILNLMNHFETVETTYFVPPFGEEKATEILFPDLQSGTVLIKPQESESMSDGLAVTPNPALFLFEKKPDRNLKQEQTCHSQIDRLIPGGRMNKTKAYEKDDNGLKVISWGSSEHRVKIVVIHDGPLVILQAARQGYGHIVKQLLHLGVGDEEGEAWGEQALRQATREEHATAVQTILLHVTPLSVRGGICDNALEKAAQTGNKQIVQLLLDAGAEVNAQGRFFGVGNALHAAAYSGNEQILRLLLNAGADINAQGGYYGNALHAAVAANSGEGGLEKVVKLLLDAGADINAEGGYFGHALQAAAYTGNEQILKLLLHAGADVNAQGGQYSNALQAAACNGHKQIVKLLLNSGADVNAQGGYFSNALQGAAYRRNEKIVKLLLNAGADVNAQGGKYGNALQAAKVLLRRFGGYEQVTKLLLDAGAKSSLQQS